ncbi:MAG: alpha-amylase family glycosyl hydrolase [Spirochaetia bacterium]
MDSKIYELWKQIYGTENDAVFTELTDLLEKSKKDFTPSIELKEDWYKDAVLYSAYVDLFAGDFLGFVKRLPYLQELGVDTLWLLPMLESPMRDQGFDISDYTKVRHDLGGNQQFFDFLEKAHSYGIKIIFDMALNHTSDQHPWFQDAKQSKDAKYRDFYIWNNNTEKYEDARLLFKGMVNSNWEYNTATDDFYFHRFYEFQPDLNYRNPRVFLEMAKACVFWKLKGVDGLRMDAIPFIWKEQGTNCENLPTTHLIIKLFRECLDYVGKGTLLMAEANMEPKDVVEYFGNGDECHTAYHFPLMPRIFLSLAESDRKYIIRTLSPQVTPDKPEECQWMSFLRCHDELTLEFVTKEERDLMNSHYLHNPRLTFREGEGIAGRLYDLMKKDVRKVLTMYSMLMTVIGTPIIYYGDEVAAENDEKFFSASAEQTGYPDARFFNRGPMQWHKGEIAEKDPTSDEAKVHDGLKAMIEKRREYCELFRVDPSYPLIGDDDVLYIRREKDGTVLTCVHNLSEDQKKVEVRGKELFSEERFESLKMTPYSYAWIIEE